jgi:hypothetical protein
MSSRARADVRGHKLRLLSITLPLKWRPFGSGVLGFFGSLDDGSHGAPFFAISFNARNDSPFCWSVEWQPGWARICAGGDNGGCAVVGTQEEAWATAERWLLNAYFDALAAT